MKKKEDNRKDLIKRIIEISFKHRLSHIGSCLSVIAILDAIYTVRKIDESVILSNGHAGLALYVLLEKYNSVNAEDLLIKHGVHPNRDIKNGIYVSTGSLGQGLPIAVGMALSDKSKNVYCVISDGECAEGSIWEATRIASEQKLNNLKIIINANGYGAYDTISYRPFSARFRSFGCKVLVANGLKKESLLKILKTSNKTEPLVVLAKTRVEYFNFLQGIDAHYKVLDNFEYSSAMKILK